MTARWKPSTAKQKALAAAVDDWENDDDGQEQPQHTTGASGGPRATVEAWPSLGAPTKMNEAVSTGPWGRTEPISNNAAPSSAASASPSPMIMSPSSGRTLPTSVLPPSTSGLGSAPQILRRDPNAQNGRGNSAEQPLQQRKTLAQREKEYEEARRRIFGDSVDDSAAATETGKKSNPTRRKGRGGGATGSAQTPGGSNSSSRSSTPRGQGRASPRTGQTSSTAAPTSKQPPS